MNNEMMMEFDAISENAEVSLGLNLSGTDIQIDGGDPEGRQFSIMLYFRFKTIIG